MDIETAVRELQTTKSGSNDEQTDSEGEIDSVGSERRRNPRRTRKRRALYTVSEFSSQDKTSKRKRTNQTRKDTSPERSMACRTLMQLKNSEANTYRSWIPSKDLCSRTVQECIAAKEKSCLVRSSKTVNCSVMTLAEEPVNVSSKSSKSVQTAQQCSGTKIPPAKYSKSKASDATITFCEQFFLKGFLYEEEICDYLLRNHSSDGLCRLQDILENIERRRRMNDTTVDPKRSYTYDEVCLLDWIKEWKQAVSFHYPLNEWEEFFLDLEEYLCVKRDAAHKRNDFWSFSSTSVVPSFIEYVTAMNNQLTDEDDYNSADLQLCEEANQIMAHIWKDIASKEKQKQNMNGLHARLIQEYVTKVSHMVREGPKPSCWAVARIGIECSIASHPKQRSLCSSKVELKCASMSSK